MAWTVHNIASKSIYILFFMPLLGTALFGYLWCLMLMMLLLLRGRVQLSGKDCLLLFVLLCFWGAKILQVGIPVGEVLIRYFYSYTIFYFYFRITGARFDISWLIKIYCIEIIVESLLINTVLPTNYWLNYPNSDTTNFSTAFFGFYQRPYSIGANATISSVILVLMLIVREIGVRHGIMKPNRNLDWLAGLAVCLFVSGGGLVFYAFYWGYRLNLYTRLRNVLALVAFAGLCVGLAVYASTLDSSHALSKISSTYFEFLLDLKLEQLEVTYQALDESSWVLGADFEQKSELLLWNDFAIRDLFHSTGFWGLGLTVLFFLFHLNRYNWFLILVAFLCIFHYGTIYAMPGAMILGYGMNLNKRNLNTFVV